jgi:hypothetical protein
MFFLEMMLMGIVTFPSLVSVFVAVITTSFIEENRVVVVSCWANNDNEKNKSNMV